MKALRNRLSLNFVFFLAANVGIQSTTFSGASAQSPVPSPAQPELQVGAILSLSGIAAAHGTAMRDGIEFAKQELEKSGRKIHIVYEDDASTPKQTVSAAERLALSGIKFVVGPTWGILAIPAEPAFRRHKMLSFQPGNSSDFVSGENPQFFFLLCPPTSAKPAIVDFLNNQPPGRVAIINVQSQWGSLWQKIFHDAAVETGHAVAFEELPQINEMDAALRTLTTRLRKDGVSILLSTTWSQGTAVSVAELERQQLPITLLSPDLDEAVGDGLVKKENRFVQGYTVIPKQDPAFVAEYTKATGHTPRKYTDSAYDTLTIIADAVAQAGNDSEAVKKLLADSFDKLGKTGRLRFNSHHDIEGAGYVIRHVVNRP